VLHQVGVGALGPVFRTYEPTRDRLIAVKVFRLDIVPEQARALADALSRATEAGLFHPSIVEPIASGVEGSVAYRAEEYVAAESLDVAMRHYAPAPIEKALPFVTQLAGAIDFARAAGIGHGGLHPRDIFITPDEARATGFGVVEALEQVGIRAPVRRPYCAPERIDGQSWGVAADIFALAAITFELLTGRKPAGLGREAGTLPDLAYREAVHGVLARAMDPDPALRYTAALAFAAALEAASRGEATADAAAAGAAAALIDDDTTAKTAIPEAVSDHTPAGHVDEPEPTLFDRAQDDEIEPTLRHHPDAYEPTMPMPVVKEPATDTRPGLTHLDEDEDSATLALHAPHAPHAHATDEFADEFVEEQQPHAEERRPLESENERALEYEPDEPAFDLHERTVPLAAPFAADDDESRRSGLASYAVVAAISLVLGFGAAYFMWGRNTTAAATAPAAEITATPSATTETPASPEPRPQSEHASSPSPASGGEAAGSAAASATPPAATPPPPAPAPKRGEITVRSTPSRAGVTVNGTWRGRTPLTLDSLPFGNYVVRVVQPNYKTAREAFALDTRNPSRTMDVRLEGEAPPAAKASARPPSPKASAGPERAAPVTFTGTLFVDSHPQGATVVIDGKPMGKTPLRLKDFRIGTHVVRLELARHRPWFSTARVVAGQEVRVAGSLEEIQ
jgi:hypothetical protein